VKKNVSVLACEDCHREWEVVCVNLQLNLHIDNWTNSSDESNSMAVTIFHPKASIGPIDLSAATPSSTLSCVAPRVAAEFALRISHSGRGIPADSGCQISPQITGGQIDTTLTKAPTEIAVAEKNGNNMIEDEHGKNRVNSISIDMGIEFNKPSDVINNMVEVNMDEHIVVKEEPQDIEYCEDFGTNFSNERDLFWGDGRSLDMAMETEDDSSLGGVSATSSNCHTEAETAASLLNAPDAIQLKSDFSPRMYNKNIRKNLGFSHVKKKYIITQDRRLGPGK
ncbi:unnamed protein product, partial [Meganyctiphanes norvegica]